MKKNRQISFLSMPMSALYVLLFAILCGMATFIESIRDTAFARKLIYNAYGFEMLVVLLVVSILWNIYYFKLYRIKKLAVMLFHIAMVFMAIGAGVTRFTGEEGVVRLREGESTNSFLREDGERKVETDLPFTLRLEDFVIDYYPGSKHPSGYKSKVVVSDKTERFSYDIYMNHILNHKGYRLFQSSFDKDERGTILSVNHDVWGMRITYLSYFLLFLGMVFALFERDSHFQKYIKELKRLKVAIILIPLFFSIEASANEREVDSRLAKAFGKLYTNDGKGRIQPLNTKNRSLLLKLSRKQSYKGMNADQVILSVMSRPDTWSNQPIFYVKEESIQKKLEITTEYASYIDFLDGEKYKLEKATNEAYRTPPEQRSSLDNAYISMTERISIFEMIISGGFFTVFPDPTDVKKKWLSPLNRLDGIAKGDSTFITKTTSRFLNQVADNEITNALETLSSIDHYQQSNSSILPSDDLRDLEIFYNELNIFSRLAVVYVLTAFSVLLICFVVLLKRIKVWKFVKVVFQWAFIFLLLVHAAGIGIRWLIGGHVPLSNGYETMVFVAWVSLAIGICFSRQSLATLGVSVLLSGITLFVAFLDFINPEITSLVPVLKSYWLSIHVAVITASYGFLGTCAFVGLLVVFIQAFFNVGIHQKNLIKELTLINKISMTVGVYLLSAGCFLGAIWANESWGRYWSWDPKETWTLISILLYSILLHHNHIPTIARDLTFNILSVFSFFSILMTYFGVNYLLAGLHSYAGEGSVSISLSFYAVVGVLVAICKVALWRSKSKTSIG